MSTDELQLVFPIFSLFIGFLKLKNREIQVCQWVYLWQTRVNIYRDAYLNYLSRNGHRQNSAGDWSSAEFGGGVVVSKDKYGGCCAVYVYVVLLVSWGTNTGSVFKTYPLILRVLKPKERENGVFLIRT